MSVSASFLFLCLRHKTARVIKSSQTTRRRKQPSRMRRVACSCSSVWYSELWQWQFSTLSRSEDHHYQRVRGNPLPLAPTIKALVFHSHLQVCLLVWHLNIDLSRAGSFEGWHFSRAFFSYLIYGNLGVKLSNIFHFCSTASNEVRRPRYIKHTNFIIDFIDIELFNIDLLRTYRAYIDLTNNIDQSVVGIRRLISFQNLYFMMMM